MRTSLRPTRFVLGDSRCGHGHCPTKEMYAQKKVLMRYADMSGTWTTEQREMIKQMKTKPE